MEGHVLTVHKTTRLLSKKFDPAGLI